MDEEKKEQKRKKRIWLFLDKFADVLLWSSIFLFGFLSRGFFDAWVKCLPFIEVRLLNFFAG